MAFRPETSQDSSRHSVPVYHHLGPAQAGNIACQMGSLIHRLEQGVADTQLRKHDPREYKSRVRGMIRRIVGDDGGTVIIELVVEFLVDGVQVDYSGGWEANRELEKEVRVAENSFVNVEALVWPN